MIIKRDGKEYQLTSQELYEAFLEVEQNSDLEDVKDLFYSLNDEDLIELYGYPKQIIEMHYKEIAHEKRRIQDKYDMSWDSARDEAVATILANIQN